MDTLVKIIIFVIVGALLIKACNRQAEIKSWDTTSGQIVSYEIEQYTDAEHRTTSNGKTKTKWDDEFRIKFTYSFIYNHSTYTGTYSIDDLETNHEVNRTLEANLVGTNILIKYNPENPYDSVYQK